MNGQELFCTRDNNPIIVATGMQNGKRKQYPLRYQICPTVHKAIGNTCISITTQISNRDSMFKLWDRQQLLVITSRVHSLDNIIFVGDVEDTMEAIRDLLHKDNPMIKMQANILNQLKLSAKWHSCCSSFEESFTNFIDCGIPSVDLGFVHLVVSSKDVLLH